MVKNNIFNENNNNLIWAVIGFGLLTNVIKNKGYKIKLVKMDKFEERPANSSKKRENKKFPYKKNRKKETKENTYSSKP